MRRMQYEAAPYHGAVDTALKSRAPINGQMIDFKFYISGGITGITPTNLKAYDINGVPVSGVSFAIQ